MSVLKNGVVITKSGFVISSILFFAFFTSYFIMAFHIPNQFIPAVENRLAAQMALHFIIALTLLLTSFFIHRINKLNLIYASSLANSIIVALLYFASNEILKTALILATGVFFSTGLLAFFTYFWDLTMPEERGRVAGVIGFVSLPFYFVVDYLVAASLDLLGIALLSIILSLLPLVVFLLRPKKVVATKKEKKGNYFENRIVLLYSIPWILFSVINATLAKNISLNILQQTSPSFYFSLTLLQGMGVILGALCGGIIADFFGRKLSLIFSLTLYGISSAVAGLLIYKEILSFVYVANGLSWGILLILYIFVIWGDMSNKENCAKMYSIGLAIYYSAIGIGVFLSAQIALIPLVVNALASCLLIFLSNVPIFLSPELLSSDFREKIRFKSHMNAVRKIKEKRKNQS